MMKTIPADFGPPKNARYFSFRITRDDGRHEVSIADLSGQELNWVGRCVAAELERRYATKLARKQSVTNVS